MNERRDAAVACAIAVTATLASLALLRVATPRVAGVERLQDEALQVTWITRPPLPVADRPVREDQAASHSVSMPTVQRTFVEPPIAPAPNTSPPPTVRLHMPDLVGPSFARDPLRRAQRDLATPNRLPGIVMRDSSFMGRITALSTISACGELRALLRRGGADAPNPDVILRSMQARGCTP